MNNGYIKLYRTLQEKGYYLDSEYVHLWVHLLMKASYQTQEYLLNGEIKRLAPGQFITGRNVLVKETHINRSKVERILKTFENEHQIEQQSTNKFRIITILNWSNYQTDEQLDEQPVSSQRAASEQPVSTYKKDKKEKNIKNKTISADAPFILPDWIPQETWIAYMAVREKKRAAKTPYALNLVIKELEKIRKLHNHDPVEVLNKSITNGWTDVYPLKDTGGQNGTSNAAPKIYTRQNQVVSRRQREIDDEADRLSREYYALQAKGNASPD